MEHSSSTAELAIVEVGEAFDLGAVPRVLEAAMHRPRGVDVVVDFSGARVISDAAVAVLLQRLRELPIRAQTRGLRQHHHTLLQYLGLTDLVRAQAHSAQHA